MINHRRRAFLFLAGSLAASGGAVALVPRHKIADDRPLGSLKDIIPAKLGSWQEDRSIVPLLPAADVQAKLDAIYNQVLARTYINAAGQRIMLSIAYGGDQSDGLRAHRPEVCYAAQGFSTRDLHKAVLSVSGKSIPVMRLVASAGARVEPITYWMTIGELVARTGLETKLAQLRYSTRGLIPDGLLVRVSNISEDSASSFRLHDLFVEELVAAMSPNERWRVVGG
jgi:EpsI family protein